MRSEGNEGLTATVVVAERWSGSSVTLMLSLTGRMRASSRFPQYLITAMLVGDRPVAVSTHCPSGAAIGSLASRRYTWGSMEMRSDRRGVRAWSRSAESARCGSGWHWAVPVNEPRAIYKENCLSPPQLYPSLIENIEYCHKKKENIEYSRQSTRSESSLKAAGSGSDLKLSSREKGSRRLKFGSIAVKLPKENAKF